MNDPLMMIYPDVRVRLKRVYASMLEQHGAAMKCCQGGRSWAYQELLFQQGRTIAGPIVTHARGGESNHNYYIAADSCFAGSDPFLEHSPKLQYLWNEFGKTVKSYGLNWGGDYKILADRPHTDLMYGLTLEDLQRLYAFGKLEAVWTKIDKIRGVTCEWKSIRNQIKTL